MIAYVRGKLQVASPGFAVVETGGIGYQIFIPANVFCRLPQVGSAIILHTCLIIRELSQALYGFLEEEEKELFLELISVSGIGPKLALSLIGHLPALELKEALAKNDVASLCKVPGVGKKTAQRLVVELQGKVATGGTRFPMPSNFFLSDTGGVKRETVSDAISALINLGYSSQIAETALKKALDSSPELSDLPGLITEALKHV